MKNSPMMGIFLGIIVILLIVVFSLGYQLNEKHKASTNEVGQRIKAEKAINNLQKQTEGLRGQINALQVSVQEKQDLISYQGRFIEELELEILKLNKLKEKLEDNLKDELIERGPLSP